MIQVNVFPEIKKGSCIDEVNEYVDSSDEFFPQIIKFFTQLDA